MSFKLLAKQAVLSISVLINGPPVTGVFSISPITGTELETKFMLFASRFSDPDLPLTFTFGFYPSLNSTDFNSLNGVSEVSYVETDLPAGQSSENYRIPCSVACYDSLGAVSSLTSTVTVAKLELDDSGINNLISSKLGDALTSGDLDVTRSVLSVSSAVVNFVNCSQTTATFCSSKNRYHHHCLY